MSRGSYRLSSSTPGVSSGKTAISPARAQLVNFTRPYYVEGAALLTSPKGKHKTFKQLLAAGKAVRASVLQNVDADKLVHEGLPQAQVMQLDTQANVIQALDSGRADAAVVDLSTVRWLVKRNPNGYVDAGHSYYPMLYGAAVRQGDPDWLKWVNTCLDVAMFGHQTEIYDKAYEDFFGQKPTIRKPGFPPF